MERSEIVNKLTSVFHDVFGDESIIIFDEMTADDVENWDSLTHMLLISKIEESFGIKFRLKELNQLKTVGDIVATIFSKQLN